jgi:ribosomal protein L28
MKQCPICQKSTIMARKLNKLRGKYNPSPKKRKYPNLQWVRIPMDVGPKFKGFEGKRIKACTKCIKSLSKLK